jgi:hypothetical protein
LQRLAGRLRKALEHARPFVHDAIDDEDPEASRCAEETEREISAALATAAEPKPEYTEDEQRRINAGLEPNDICG